MARFVVSLGVASISILAAWPAQAQFVCVQDNGGLDPAGATATGAGAVACGTSATAAGDNSAAFGNTASAAGTGASALGSNSSAAGTSGTAIGNAASSGTGNNSTAIGANATINNTLGGTAIGQNAYVNGDNSTAIGQGAQAGTSTTPATNATAIGQGAQALHDNSTAIGVGAQTTRANQMMFGTATTTYTLPGLARGAPGTYVVTTDRDGNLAAQTPAEAGLATSRDITGVKEGVAIALAMAGVPIVLPKERFAVTANWGNYEGQNGFAGGLALKYNENIQINGGIGFGADHGSIGGRAGVRIGW